MIRVVLAVLLTVALFAVALPAVEDARVARATVPLDHTATQLSKAGVSLVETETAVRAEFGSARRFVALDAPPPSFVTARLDNLRLRCRTGKTVTLAASVGGRQRTTTAQFPTPVTLRVPPAGDDEPVVRLTRQSTLRLTYRLLDGTETLVIGREGSSTVTGPVASCSATRSTDSGRQTPTRAVGVESPSTMVVTA